MTATEFLERYWDLLLPVNIDDLIKRNNIEVKPLSKDLGCHYQGIATDDYQSDRKIIYVDPDLKPNEMRFYKAHALGHHILGHLKNKMSFLDNLISIKSNSIEEQEANLFASEIIVPSEAVLRLAGSKGFRTEYDLAVLFDVSIGAIHEKLQILKIIPKDFWL